MTSPRSEVAFVFTFLHIILKYISSNVAMGAHVYVICCMFLSKCRLVALANDPMCTTWNILIHTYIGAAGVKADVPKFFDSLVYTHQRSHLSWYTIYTCTLLALRITCSRVAEYWSRLYDVRPQSPQIIVYIMWLQLHPTSNTLTPAAPRLHHAYITSSECLSCEPFAHRPCVLNELHAVTV